MKHRQRVSREQTMSLSKYGDEHPRHTARPISFSQSRRRFCGAQNSLLHIRRGPVTLFTKLDLMGIKTKGLCELLCGRQKAGTPFPDPSKRFMFIVKNYGLELIDQSKGLYKLQILACLVYVYSASFRLLSFHVVHYIHLNHNDLLTSI